MIRELASELRADVLSPRIVPALAAGFTSGLGLLVAQIAFGAFIFSGALAPWSSQGVALVLFGNLAACLIIAVAGGFRGAISGLSPALVIVMALIGSTMEATGDALFVTTAGALVLAAFVTGSCCMAIGYFRLAGLMRFIPYPVAAGFVAGIGGAVCLAALSLMGAEPDWRSLPALVEPSMLWKWAPGAAFGIALYLAMKRWGNALILPVSVALAVGACHLALAALGLSGDEARAAGILFTSTAEGVLWPVLRPGDVAHVDWGAMAGQIPNMLTLALVALVCVVMNVAGLELAAGEELDWNREFRATGLASLVAGAGGGTVATLIVPASLRSKLFGAATRLTGIVAALVIAGALFAGDRMLELVPVPLVGGILVFAGLGMLDEGLVRSCRRLPWPEFGIIVLIFLTIIAVGLLEGIGVGMMAALLFFAVRLSRVDPVESRLTLDAVRSNRARPVPDRAILVEEAGRARIYRLRGYLFFGSIYPLTDDLRQVLHATSRPVCLMLDFTRVSGLDYSAVNVLGRVLLTARALGVEVVLSAPSAKLMPGLERTLGPAAFAALQIEPTADRGLERCEDLIIAAWKTDAADGDRRRAALLGRTVDDLERHLERQIQHEDLIHALGAWLTPRDYAAGEILAGPDNPPAGLQLMQTGHATAYDPSGARLHQCHPGDPVWPGDRTVRVVADEPCRTMELAEAALRWLEEQEEALALELYRYLLAGRIDAGPRNPFATT